jgi:hypothetical protein
MIQRTIINTMDDVDTLIGYIFWKRNGRIATTLAKDICIRWLCIDVENAFLRAEEIQFITEAACLADVCIGEYADTIADVPEFTRSVDLLCLLHIKYRETKYKESVHYCSKIVRKFLTIRHVPHNKRELIITKMFNQLWTSSEKINSVDAVSVLYRHVGGFITFIFNYKFAKHICGLEENDKTCVAFREIIDLEEKSPFKPQNVEWLKNGIFDEEKLKHQDTSFSVPHNKRLLKKNIVDALTLLVPFNYKIILRND